MEPHDHASGAGGGRHRPGGLRGRLRALRPPHGHDSAEAVAAALAATDEGVRTIKVSLAALAATAAIQLVVVVASGSVALLSDTVHNFADALTAVPLGVAFWLGRRAPTRRYNYGFGRAEDLAGILIVCTIAGSSVLAAWEALSRLQHPRALHGVAWVAAAGVVGFVGNETVAVYRIRVGRRIGSASLVADGLHARTDGLTSLAVVAGAAGAGAGWQQADPAAGLLITLAVLVVLKDAARDIYRRLMDSVDPDLLAEVEKVLAAVPGIQRVDTVRLRWLGHELRAEAEVVSDSDLTIAQGHAIAEEAHHRLLHDIPRLAQATIHTSPCTHSGGDPHQVTAHHFSSAAGDRGPDAARARGQSSSGPG